MAKKYLAIGGVEVTRKIASTPVGAAKHGIEGDFVYELIPVGRVEYIPASNIYVQLTKEEIKGL